MGEWDVVSVSSGTPVVKDDWKVVSIEKPSIKTPGLFGSSLGKDKKIMATARVPSQVAKGISIAMMDAIEPETSSVPLNAAIRFPQTLASIGAEGVASTLSPESVAVGGALKSVQLAKTPIKATGKAIGSGFEKLSGLGYKNPGILAEVTAKPGLPFEPGVEAANATYAKMVDPAQIRDSFKTILGKKEFVEAAIQEAKAGTLTADEALIARQGLDQIKNTVPRHVFFTVRDILDTIAKTKFKSADIARTTAQKADALTNVFPLNKGGTPSRLGQVVQGAAVGGFAINPAVALTAPAISPFGQALAASVVGVTRKVARPLINNPEIGVAVNALKKQFLDGIRDLMEKNKKK